MKNAKIVQLWV